MKTISKAHKEQEVLIGSYDDLVLYKPLFILHSEYTSFISVGVT